MKNVLEFVEPTNELLVKLSNHLPFSVNSIDSIINYRDRTEIYELKANPSSVYFIVFHSFYNSHIWYSPIIWFIGKIEDEDILVYSIDYFLNKFKSFVALSEFPISLKLERIRTFGELLMVKNKSIDLSDSKEYMISHLTERNAEQSINLSYTVEPESKRKSTIESEKIFLKERETFGIFFNDMLVCRGSIMAKIANYSTVGGFVTHPEYRRMGLAKFLVNHVSKTSENMGFKPALTVRENNEIAISMYSKLGYEKKQEVTFIDAGSGVIP